MPPDAPYAWAGSVRELLALAPRTLLAAIAKHQSRRHGHAPTASHRQAWRDSARVLTAALKGLPRAADWTCALEYELPYEGGRRADLVILADTVIVVEFKGYRNPAPPNVDQVAAYARDLSLYHAETHDKEVHAILVLTRRVAPAVVVGGVTAVGPDGLAAALDAAAGGGPVIDPAAWLASDYAPLPGVVAAARRVFAEEPLPAIRRAASSRVPQVVTLIGDAVARAEAGSERHLVLVTGVPGAGKTLVGLTAVHAHGVPAVYLTGNGPLVEVLRYALGSKALVRPVRNFYLRYKSVDKLPRENLFVFDEAQRAWDAARMGAEYGIPTTAGEAVLAVADRAPGWAVVVALLGEGQEIHAGEEEGPGQWAAGIKAASNSWRVHAPPHLAGLFGRSKRVHARAELHLDTALRSHRAGALPAWAAAIVDGRLAEASRVADELRAGGYVMNLSRDLNHAKAYLAARYEGEPDKTYGLIASSRARNLTQYGVPNDYLSTRRVAAGPWYVDAADSPRSCRRLDACVTEFGSQGLELDTPLVCWGGDLTWGGAAWATTTRQAGVRDALRLRRNSYRVLLTRGRDGVVAFVPPEPGMDPTAGALLEAGFAEWPASESA